MRVPAADVIAYIKRNFPLYQHLCVERTAEGQKLLQREELHVGIASHNIHTVTLLAKLLSEVFPRPSDLADDFELQRLQGYLESRLVLYEARAGKMGVRAHYGYPGGYNSDPHNLDPDKHFLKLVVDILERCPSRPGVERLDAFGVVKSKAYRKILLEDLREVENALKDGNYKAATVIGGSLIEALLFYRLDVERACGKPLRVQAFTAALPTKQNGTPKVFNKLHLAELADMALTLGFIGAKERALVEHVGGYRNLVHAGKVHRSAERCDRATAHLAYSALLVLDRHLRGA